MNILLHTKVNHKEMKYLSIFKAIFKARKWQEKSMEY